MKRLIALTGVALFAFAAYASAQSSSNPSAANRPLADVARAEEARRKTVKKPAKVYTNASLKPDPMAGGAGPSVETPVPASGNTSPSSTTPTPPVTDRPKEGQGQDQAYWQNRIKTARDTLARSQMFADSLQTRINSLQTDFINRDNPVEKAQLERDRNAALAELERVKKEMEEQSKQITAIEDEARRAGVPAGWLRPGA